MSNEDIMNIKKGMMPAFFAWEAAFVIFLSLTQKDGTIAIFYNWLSLIFLSACLWVTFTLFFGSLRTFLVGYKE